ncbi:glutamine--tRNA ligase [Malassezia sp. CBS 17886]|nr:glutamine--tRNA ligase [Malassezia sp. CBS 17886]
MAPKLDPADPAVARLLALFESISLTGQRAQDTVKNPKYARSLERVITSLGLGDKGLDAKTSSMVVVAASHGADLPADKLDYVAARIVGGDLRTADQIHAACAFVAASDVDKDAFDRACGVGVTVTPDACREAVRAYVDAHHAELQSSGGWPSMSAVMGAVRSGEAMRWASAADVKTAVEEELTARFGPRPGKGAKGKGKGEAGEGGERGAGNKTNGKAAKGTAEQAGKVGKAHTAPGELRPDAMFQEGFLAGLHKPGGNPQKVAARRAEHLAATKGAVMTRFPPEPNGYLHIGHSKAIAVNFGYARFHGGLCYLRFDDTNPEAEEEKYFTSILDTVRWLGFEPYKVTYSSDYFARLYELAVDLIRRGLAYVDHSSADEIRAERGGALKGPRHESRWRARPVAESLAEFEKMRNGTYRPGEATLRMKQDILGSGNPQMWDLIAYRVLDAPHHRTGATWCMYPTYDFTHCLVDSLENISHSLCTTEFILARESYEWLCDALEVYRPRQYEYGRLSLEGTVMSKRRIRKLVEGGYVRGWDDPRMYTLIGLRRRGVPPGAVLAFVNALGVTTHNAMIQTDRFDQTVRQYLELNTPRLMMVVAPLRVTLENLPPDFVLPITKPLHPKVAAMGSVTVPFTRTVYIDASDFRTHDAPDYFRLAPGKTVGLYQVPHPVTCTSFRTDPATGRVVELVCRYESGAGAPTPKTYIQWVGAHAASGSPVRVREVRFFENLFTCENPAAEEHFLDHINPRSLVTYTDALLEVAFYDVARAAVAKAREEIVERERLALAQRENVFGKGAPEAAPTIPATPSSSSAETVGKECIRFQAMRVGYFAVDKDSTLPFLDDRDAQQDVVLNRIVSLKEGGWRAARKNGGKMLSELDEP